MPRDALHLPNTDTRTTPLARLVQPIRAQAFAGWRWHARLPARGRLQSGKTDRVRDGHDGLGRVESRGVSRDQLHRVRRNLSLLSRPPLSRQ
jgi:hypothetical protein